MSTTPRTDEAIRKYRFLGSGPLELEGRFADFARELETELAAERAIVSRIWVQLGSPTYTDLKGRSIYDLIDEIKTDRAEAKQEAAHYMSVAQKATDELACEKENRNHLIEKGAKLETELAAAKAECERLKFASEGHLLKTIQQQAELARLRAELAVAENWVEHHSKHADDLIAENVKLRADLERFTGHGLLDCHAICDQRDAAIARAERAEADKARLDWLEAHALPQHSPNISISDLGRHYNGFPGSFRAAIDAAMKGTT